MTVPMHNEQAPNHDIHEGTFTHPKEGKIALISESPQQINIVIFPE
jgi:hypothetical protein